MCPSLMNGIVGFKPTVGLVSRTHVIPISPTQDTAGPMTRSVKDAAMMLSAIAGTDAADPATAPADEKKQDYTAALETASLQGTRIGVMRFAEGSVPAISEHFAAALQVLESQGAILVDIEEFSPPENLGPNQSLSLRVEFKASLNDYLATTPDNISTRTLSDLIEYNKQHADREFALFGQDIFTESEEKPGLEDEAFQDALASLLEGTRANGIDRLLAEHDVDLLVVPTTRPAFMLDYVHSDTYPGGVGTIWLAAIAGYPHLTVPMGEMRGLPIGISFISSAWDDAAVLEAGYLYEQNSQKIMAPTYRKSVKDLPEIKAVLAPLSQQAGDQ